MFLFSENHLCENILVHLPCFFLLAKVHKSVGFGSAERCNDDDDDKRTAKLRLMDDGWWMRDPSSLRSVGMTSLGEIHHTPQNSSTSPSVLQYLALSTRVLGPKYCGTCTKVLIVTWFFWFIKEVNVNVIVIVAVRSTANIKLCFKMACSLGDD